MLTKCSSTQRLFQKNKIKFGSSRVLSENLDSRLAGEILIETNPLLFGKCLALQESGFAGAKDVSEKTILENIPPAQNFRKPSPHSWKVSLPGCLQSAESERLSFVETAYGSCLWWLLDVLVERLSSHSGGEQSAIVRTRSWKRFPTAWREWISLQTLNNVLLSRCSPSHRRSGLLSWKCLT